MEKFTIILLHYNQNRYLETSLNSILSQNYENIELIIADDCSEQFDQNEIIEYINKKKGNNIANVKFVINKENVGTVKTINRSIKKSTGTYLLFFAADDRLSTKHTISDYVDTFKKYSKEADVVCFQGKMYGSQLIGKNHDFLDEEYGEELNEMSQQELLEEMSKECIFVAGATAFKKSIFNKDLYFDEKYKLIEDWPFYIKSSRLGIKYHYENIPGLDHRDGGVSHHIGKKIPPHVVQFYKDIFRIYEFEIMPYMKTMSLKTQLKIIKCFNYYKCMYGNKMNIKPNKSFYFAVVNSIYLIYDWLLLIGKKVYEKLFNVNSLIVYCLLGQISFGYYLLSKNTAHLKILLGFYIVVLCVFVIRLFIRITKKIGLKVYRRFIRK